MKQYRDHYFRKAKQEHFPARSVYKLQEIDKKFRLLSRGMTVLDLGAAPGSWTLYAAQAVGSGGRVLGVDLQATDTAFPANATVVQGDVFDPAPEVRAAMTALAPFDVVISDMAPKTSGVKFRDQALSFDLCQRALEMAGQMLKPGGAFVVKMFEGPDTKAYLETLRRCFDRAQGFKPKSSREESKETFFVGLGFRGAISQTVQEEP